MENLPMEILEEIFYHLDIKCLLNLRNTCKSLQYAVDSTDYVWQIKFAKRWPWAMKQLNLHNARKEIKLWRNEVKLVITLEDKIEKYIKSLTTHLYKEEQMTYAVRHYIKALGSSSKHSMLYIKQIMKIFIKKDCRMMTFQYYAKKLYLYVHSLYCYQMFDTLYNDVDHIQDYERWHCLLSQWFCIHEDVDFLKTKNQLNDITRQVLVRIRDKSPTHPILMQPLQSHRNYVKITPMKQKDVLTIMQSIDHIFFVQMKFSRIEGAKIGENLLCSVLNKRVGEINVLLVIILCIGQRLGVMLELTMCQSLRWITDESTNNVSTYMTIVEDRLVLQPGKIENVKNDNRFTFEQQTAKVSVDTSLTNIRKSIVYYGNHESHPTLWYTIDLIVLLHSEDEYTRTLLQWRLKDYNQVEMTDDNNWKVGALEQPPENQPIKEGEATFEYLKELINRNSECESEVPQVFRSGNIHTIDYAVGCIFCHKLYNYLCVVRGWSPTCEMPTEWIDFMSVNQLSKKSHQPFYHVLVEDGTERYAAQENLIPESHPRSIDHPEMGRYFDSFDGHCYIPNDAVMLNYPDDENERKDYVRKMKF